ncbi:MAG: hypothetical protein R3C09_20810 [Pirellulaceae bacterium]
MPICSAKHALASLSRAPRPLPGVIDCAPACAYLARTLVLILSLPHRVNSP